MLSRCCSTNTRLIYENSFYILFVLITYTSFAQNIPPIPAVTKAVIARPPSAQKTHKDTVIESDTSKENKEPRYFYVSVNTDVFVNTTGGAG